MITHLGVLNLSPDGLVAAELAPEVTPEVLAEKTGAPVTFAPISTAQAW